MHMIADAGRSFTRDELIAAIAAKFGEDARFHTCSAENMACGELIDFLQARGKFLGDGSSMTIDSSQICQH